MARSEATLTGAVKLAASLALAIALALPSTTSARAVEPEVVSDEMFCEMLTSDVAGCLAVLGMLAAEGLLPASMAGLVTLPTSRPTDGLTAAGDPRWPVFLDHVVAENAAVTRLLDAAASAADDFDLARLEAILGQLIERSRAEIAWLDSEPPSTCFEAAHADWRATMVGLRTAARTTLRGVRARDPGELQNGVQGLAGYALEVPRDVDRLQRGEADVAC